MICVGKGKVGGDGEVDGGDEEVEEDNGWRDRCEASMRACRLVPLPEMRTVILVGRGGIGALGGEVVMADGVLRGGGLKTDAVPRASRAGAPGYGVGSSTLGCEYILVASLGSCEAFEAPWWGDFSAIGG